MSNGGRSASVKLPGAYDRTRAPSNASLEFFLAFVFDLPLDKGWTQVAPPFALESSNSLMNVCGTGNTGREPVSKNGDIEQEGKKTAS